MRVVGLMTFVLLLIASCRSKTVPKEFIQPEKMGNVLWDISLAEEFVNVFVMKDSTKVKETEIQKEYQKVFQHHNISHRQFENSYRFYAKNPVIFRTVMDTVSARAQRQRQQNYGRSRVTPLKK